MTLILGIIGDDGIVLSADGRAVYEHSYPPDNNLKKIYPLEHMFVGIGGRGFMRDDEEQIFLSKCRTFIETSPSDVHRYAEFMLTVAKVYSENKTGFEIGILLAGYDLDNHNRSTVPRLYRIALGQDCKYKLTTATAGRYEVICDAIPNMDILPTMRQVEHLRTHAVSAIRANKSETVGGDITTVVITKDGWHETILRAIK